MGLLSAINDATHGVLGVVALLAFFAMFIGVLVWTFSRPRKEMEHLARLPIDDDDR